MSLFEIKSPYMGRSEFRVIYAIYQRALRAFLDEQYQKYPEAPAEKLLKATVDKFGYDEAILKKEIEHYFHVNCTHGDLDNSIAREMVSQLGTKSPETIDKSVQSNQRNLEAIDTKPFYLMAFGLFLLLIVNTILLVVLIKRSKTDP